MKQYKTRLARTAMTLLIALLTTTMAWAEETLTVYDGTNTSGIIPFDGTYADTQGAASEFIIPSDQLENMTGGTITAMKFYISKSASEAWTGTHQVYVGEVEATTLTGITGPSSFTVVKEASFDATGTELTVEFDEPYPYGGGNLLIGTYVSVAGNWKSASFYGVSQTGNTAWHSGSQYGSGGVMFLPKTTFTYAFGSVTVCNMPTLSVSDITSDGATLTFSGGSGTYNVQYKLASADNWTTIASSTTGTSFTLTGLTPSTTYDVRAQSVCDADATSGWRTVSFNTDCTAITTFPWTEDFNGLTTAYSIPNCWDNSDGTITNISDKWCYNTNTSGNGATNGTSHDGSKCVRFDSYINTDGKTNFLKTPVLSLPANTPMQLSFWYKNPAGGDFSVYISTDGGNTYTTALATELTGKTSWTEHNPINLSDYAGQDVVIVFKGTSNYAYNDAYIYLDDVTVEEVSAYPKPTDLTVSAITSNTAILTWTENGTATQWQICLNDDETQLITVNEKSYTFNSLATLTAYTAKVRAIGQEGYSPWSSAVSFTTTAVATAVGDSWSDNFEGTSCGWELINGTCTNVWAWGTATNNGGTHALYVSNDGGTTNAYTNDSGTMVYATKILNFVEGKYEFSYDWIAFGESTHDYLRVALVPATVTLTAGTSAPSVPNGYFYSDLPTGWIALDGGSKLNQSIAWQSKTQTINVAAGNYYLVVAWRNDTSSGNNPPAAIDNVSITKVTCSADVTGLAVNSLTTTSAALTWTAGEASQWQVAYSAAGNFEDATEVIVSSPTYGITGLQHNTHYYARVRAYCGGEDFGSWSDVLQFNTDCETVTAYPWMENFDSYTAATGVLPNCWSRINTCTNSSYSSYPCLVSSYANSSPNCLRFNSYYSSSNDYDPQPQYAILPPMENLTGKQITLYAKGATTASTFKIGTMTNPFNASTFKKIAEQTLTTSYPEEPFEYIIPDDCNDSYVVIMIDAATSSRTTNSVYIDDIVICEAPACIKPIGLAVTANSITGDGATITWTARGSETSWKIEYATDANFTSPSYATVNEDPTYTFHGLDESTTYYVHVQADCGNIDGSSEYSKTVSFSTTQTPVNLPYFNDFESTNGWLFVNGDLTNAWAYGTATSNGEGTYAIYVSNDGGTTNAYTNNSYTMVYATKMFNFEAGTYVFSYDWKADGETTYDYLRVALVPSSVTLTAGVYAPSVPSGTFYNNLPTGWIALDGGTKLNLKSDWQSFESSEINIATAGTYMMVFAWRNDNTTGNNPPAAIDNVSIEVITCKTPTGLTAPQSGITATSAQLSWTETGQANAWQIELTDAENNTKIIDADSNPFTLTSLTPETVYSARVRANCGDGYSKWSEEVIFETVSECQTPDGLDATNVTTTRAVISWNGYGIETFNLRYTTDGESWTTKTNVTNPYTLTGLDVATTYTVQVQPTCAGEDTWSTSFVFSTQCVAITTFPWSEGFEVGAFSSCWSQDGKGTWTVGTGDYVSSTGAHTGTYNAKIVHKTKGNITKLMTPVFDLSSLTCPVLSFWYINRKWQSDIDKFAVYYRTAPDAEWIQIDATEEAHEEWTKAEYLLPNPSATYQIAFEMTDGYGYGVGIDDVTIEGVLGLADAGSDNSADIEDYDRETVNVVLSGRTLWQDGYWNTLCLPFSLDEDELDASQLSDADIRTLDNAEFNDGTLTLNFTPAVSDGTVNGVAPVTSIEAGKPYIIKWSNGTNITDPVFTNVTIDKTTHNVECDLGDGKSITFLGTYDYMSFDSENRSILFLGDNNTLYWPLSGASIGACRAYFKLKGLSASEVSTTRLFFGGEETTSLPQPLQREGSQAGAWYTLDGRKLDGKPAKKGVYINNGVKVVIK
jgi:hypothetical protein